MQKERYAEDDVLDGRVEGEPSFDGLVEQRMGGPFPALL